MTGATTYRVFGLDVRFPRPLATLRGALAEPLAMPDVEVDFAPIAPFAVRETVNEDLELDWSAHELAIQVDEVGRFLVRDGNTVIADPYPGASRDEVDLYLAGSVMGAVLHQRGVLPLHCNAFDCEGSAVLLCGDSGAGKSTLAAWFEARGYPLLTDDVCSVTFGPSGPPLAHPGIPRLRLWDDALEMTGRSGTPGRPVPWAEGKFELEMNTSRARDALPIAAIYHLCAAEPEGDFAITPLRGLAAVDAITSNIYRRRIGDIVGHAPRYLQGAARLVKDSPIFRIDRRWGMENFTSEAKIMESHFIFLSNCI
jgi:hypothetical protein